jgi:hypothetical protein
MRWNHKSFILSPPDRGFYRCSGESAVGATGSGGLDEDVASFDGLRMRKVEYSITAFPGILRGARKESTSS